MYIVYGRENCEQCDKIKNILKEKGMKFTYEDMDEVEKTIKANLIKESRKIKQVNLPIVIGDDGKIVPNSELINLR